MIEDYRPDSNDPDPETAVKVAVSDMMGDRLFVCVIEQTARVRKTLAKPFVHERSAMYGPE